MDHVREHHLPVPAVLLAVALAVELVTWIGLVIGFRARLAAGIAFLYMIPVTLVFHAFMSTQFRKTSESWAVC